MVEDVALREVAEALGNLLADVDVVLNVVEGCIVGYPIQDSADLLFGRGRCSVLPTTV